MKALCLMAAVATCGLAMPASAALIPAQSGIVQVTNPGGSVDRVWEYSLTLTAGETVNTGDFVTLYDITGFQPGFSPGEQRFSAPPAGWSFSNAATGPTPTGITVTDSLSLQNVTFTRTGAPIVAIADMNVPGPFYFKSTSPSNFRTGQYASDTLTNASGGVVLPLPEPGSIGLIVFAAGGLLMHRRRSCRLGVRM